MASHCIFCPEEFDSPDELSTHLLTCKSRIMKDFR